jgi:hypothetical protein
MATMKPGRHVVSNYLYLVRHLMSLLKRRRAPLIVSTALFFVYCVLYYLPASESPTRLVCPQSPLSDDVLLVIRTGATEAREKLPIHFRTTLRCVNNYVIYSDLAEEIDGHRVYDVLDEVDDDIKTAVPEFKLYNHLKANGRAGLDVKVQFGSGPFGAVENPGWKLDKWKFLPMISKALRHAPRAKWFVFIEPDTYLMWSNLLQLLSRLDSSQPQYLGNPMFIGDTLFGHGGSGFVISKPALEKAVEHMKPRQKEYDTYVFQSWAGDMVLGQVLKEAGVDLAFRFPHFQRDAVAILDLNHTNVDLQSWCYAAVTYHHMRKEDIQRLWKFEQDWHQRAEENSILRHRDVFREFIAPQLRGERGNWDNLATGFEYSENKSAALPAEQLKALTKVEKDAQSSVENCRAVCESYPACLQYSYSAGTCSISPQLRLGRHATSQCLEYSDFAESCNRSKSPPSKPTQDEESLYEDIFVRSGWMTDRIPGYIRDMDQSCHDNVWVN